MSLVINADDFGISDKVNSAIKECFEKGYINRTTIMVNTPFTEAAARIAAEGGFSDRVGLHINITQGYPLTDNIRNNRDFCDESGRFNAAFYKSTFKRLHMDRRSMDDLYDEIKAQLDKYKELGFTLNHMDSHHHVHTNYPVYRVLKKLTREYEFSSIRLSRNLYRGGSAAANIYKKLYNSALKKICNDTTEYFGSYKDAADYFSGKSIKEIRGDGHDGLLESNQNASETAMYNSLHAAIENFSATHDTEIMVHPMYLSDGTLSDTEMPFGSEHIFYD